MVLSEQIIFEGGIQEYDRKLELKMEIKLVSVWVMPAKKYVAILYVHGDINWR